jgi:NADPH:quinone reductase-like Zn-dependent oxidoreductase
MQAMIVTRFGDPEVLQAAEQPDPEPGPAQVRLRVLAAGVNPADWKYRRGLVRRAGEPPFTLGLDVSGIVDAVGEGVIHAAAGGVGHIAVQIAGALGATVVATARGAKHKWLRGLGAHELIDYTTQDFVDAAGTVDAVIDPIAEEYAVRSLAVLRPGGVLVDGGKLGVTVSRTLPLLEAAEAHRLSETGRVSGKIVLVTEPG